MIVTNCFVSEIYLIILYETLWMCVSAVAQVFNALGVDFAISGPEETSEYSSCILSGHRASPCYAHATCRRSGLA